jgi:hypothetical protein
MKLPSNFQIRITNRKALCPICHNYIKKKEKRIFCNLGTGYFGLNYHIKCFLRQYEETIRELFYLLMEEKRNNK